MFETNEQTIWVEKYRPTELKDVVGNKHLKETLNEFVDKKIINQILLYGPAGTGKTTVAKILCNKIAPNNYLYINASDETSVENIRTKVKQFASTIGFGGIKIIHLDESDFLSLNAMAALRRISEDFSKNTRFILTCNYIDKIIPAIQSRFQTFKFEPLSDSQIIKYVATILEKEKIQYEPKDVIELVKTFKPDIRKIVNTLQQNVNNNILSLNKKDIVNSDFKVLILNTLKNKKSFNKIRQIIADNSVSQFTEVYSYLFKNIHTIIDNEDELLDYYIKIAEYTYRDSIIADGEINFMGFVADVQRG